MSVSELSCLSANDVLLCKTKEARGYCTVPVMWSNDDDGDDDDD